MFEDFILLTAFKAFLKSGRDFHDQVAGRLSYNLLLPRAQLPRATESRERERVMYLPTFRTQVIDHFIKLKARYCT